MPYIGKSPGKLGVRQRYHYTATGSETSKSGSDDNGLTLKFEDGEYVDVYLNGSLLVAGSDYNTTTANTISGLAALSANDILEVIVYDIYSLAKTNSEAQRTKYYKTAVGGETSITGTDDNGATITFTAGAQIDVRLNGVSLKQGDDYNTTVANTVGGLTALTAGQLVEIVVYEKFVLADMVKKSGDTMTGALTATSFHGDGSNLTGVGVDGITSNLSSGTALTIDTNGNVIAEGVFLPKERTGSLAQGGRMFVYTDSSNINWVVHEFRSSGMFWVPTGGKTCDVLIVGGGGSGGVSYGDQDTGKGGGGAGAALWRQSYSVSAGNYEIVVGQGGTGSTVGPTSSIGIRTASNNGGESRAFGAIAHGGGFGGASDNNNRAAQGGCGGGGGARNTNSGWNDGRPSSQPSVTGWTSYTGSGGGSANGNYSGGGGGGIGGNGSNHNGVLAGSTAEGGAGGAGRDFSSYFGPTVGHFGWFGGGGGGGTYRTGTNTMYQAPPNGGVNNYGGGGFGSSSREGSQTNPNVNANDSIHGIDGTGGGGGGSAEDHENIEVGGQRSGSGGCGCVVIRYQL